MPVTKIFFFLGIVVLAVALIMFGWLYLPLPRQRTSHAFTPEQLTPGSGQNPPGPWTLELTAPRRIPLGQTGTIRLAFTPVPAARGSTPDPSTGYGIRAEARAEIPAAGASPSGLSSQALSPRNPVQFTWQVRPQSEGRLEGRVWLYLRFVPKDGGDAVERPLSVQPVTIQSVTFFGRATDQVLQMALIALGLGCVLMLPHLVLLSRHRQMRANL